MAHEVLEAPWRRAGAPLYRQDAAQALIQLCAAYVQRSRPNARGARLLVARAADRLSRPVDGAIDAALVAAGIDRAALLRRLSVLPESVEAWPSILDLLLGGETDRP